MKSYFCMHQERVTAAIQAGEWPDACNPELRAHVEACQACSDLSLVAETLRQSRNTAGQMPQKLPSPGILWWRAQIRRRNAAIERMTRPVAIAESVALLIVLLAAATLVVWQRRQLTAWFSSVWDPFASFAQAPGLLTLGLGSMLIIGAFAVYLLRAKE